MKIFVLIKHYIALAIIFFYLALTIFIYHLFPRPYGVKVTSWLIRWTLFLPVTIEGEDEDENVQMFILNHESDIDIGIMETVTKKDLAWVAKKELFDIPFFGYLLKFPKDIAVERESKTALIKMLRDCKDRLDHNRVITIFPEGTRSVSKTMLPFKAGAKMVADKYKLKVQPLVFVNTSSYFSSKLKIYNSGRVKVIRMKSFTADRSNPDWLKECRIEMQKVYDRELELMASYR